MPSYEHRPWTVCFYAPHGGVGCTTLATNVAFAAASGLVDGIPKRPTCLLDLNFETPGLDTAPAFSDAYRSQNVCRGFVEYLSELERRNESPEIRDFATEALIGRLDAFPGFRAWDLPGDPDEGPLENRAKLHVVYAGRRDAEYRKALRLLDWRELYLNDGQDRIEDFRVGLKAVLGAHLLIVDTATGNSSGYDLVVDHLADALVIVFQPNRFWTPWLRDVVARVRRREERERRRLPRLYVASHYPEDFCHGGGQRTSWSSIKVVARNMVAECEGTPPAEVEDGGHPGNPIAPASPCLAFVPRMDEFFYVYEGDCEPSYWPKDAAVYDAVADAVLRMQPPPPDSTFG